MASPNDTSPKDECALHTHARLRSHTERHARGNGTRESDSPSGVRYLIAVSPLILLGIVAQAAPIVSPIDEPPSARQGSAPQTSPRSETPQETIPAAPIRTQPAAVQQHWRTRRFGVHLGINATLLFDVSAANVLYFGAATQLTGLAWFFDTARNFNLSLLAFGGVALPIIEREQVRFTLDAAPALTYTHAAPVNLLSVGVLAGVRVVHRSGFTFAVKLPIVGYAGAPDAQRGGLLMYYTNAIVTVPAITFGYSF